jgi:hypothetical protein
MALVHLGEFDYTVEQVVELFYAPQEGESDGRMDQDIRSQFSNPPMNAFY